MLRPRSGNQQWIARDEFLMSGEVTAHEFTDSFGNLCQRVHAPSGDFSLSSSVFVETTSASDSEPGAPFVEVDNLPHETI
ncbi:hypothetical protein N9B73_01470 [Verrucomicrobiales bacterium]|nr:hypothetical protein [Verrucomicrobiales bacterium]